MLGNRSPRRLSGRFSVSVETISGLALRTRGKVCPSAAGAFCVWIAGAFLVSFFHTNPVLAQTEASNHLAGETSAYLRLHADDPVDWYPWGQEALDLARIEDRPIFLSIGFSACHWCREMEREVFSAPWLGRILNRSFVNIKVDREERPDLDAIYLAATQLITGRSGWPISIFLTPDLEPFFAATYLPLRDRPGQPGLATIARTLEHAWFERRIEVEAQAHEVAIQLEQRLAQWPKPVKEVPPAEVARAAYDGFVQRFDEAWGGFGKEPKFPSVPALSLVFDFVEREPRARAMIGKTLDQMARGALYDHVGGGFHRYTIDRSWRRPRFEKLLTDNAQLLDLYARWQALEGDVESAEVVRRTVEFLLREMRLPGGGLRASIAADSSRTGTSDEEEGAFYLWTEAELEASLGREDYLWLKPLWGLDQPTSFAEGRLLPFLPKPLDEQAPAFKLEVSKLRALLGPLRAKLLAKRAERPRPLTNDQVIAAGNGLAIAALARAGQTLDEPSWIDSARQTARFVLAEMITDKEGLRHAWQEGKASGSAFLDDYAFLVHGLLTLGDVTGEAVWTEQAVKLVKEQQSRLRDSGGGFYRSAEKVDAPLRSLSLRDASELSGQAMSVLNFVDLARLTGDRAWFDEARSVLLATAEPLLASPPSLPGLALAVSRYQAASPKPEEKPANVPKARP